MSKNYLGEFSTRTTPQSEPIPSSAQEQNSAGGYSWKVDDWTLLSRFLILGNEGGSYYAGEREMTKANANCVLRCLDDDPVRAISTIINVSVAGRAPKNDPAIFALVLAASHKSAAVRSTALEGLSQVCRTGTHLFTFLSLVEKHRGWGRSLRRAVGKWYTDKQSDDLAYQVVKYRQRAEWKHRDPLRLAHPANRVSSGNPTLNVGPVHEAIFQWSTKGTYPRDDVRMPPALEAYIALTGAKDSKRVVGLIKDYGRAIPWEAIPDEMLDADVWRALLRADLPMTALMRKLPVLTRLNVLTPSSPETALVCNQLRDGERLRKARVHPIALLNAHRTYLSGHGRGSAWTPLPSVADALEDAFYLAFDYQEPTGKRWCIGLDVSGSMDGSKSGFRNITGMPNLTPREAAAAMAMVCMKTGDPYEVVAFTSARSYGVHGHRYSAYPDAPQEAIPGLAVVPLSPRQRLADVIDQVSKLYPGGTDAALPMIYATQFKREFDVFSLYTDSETWAGRIHPAQALNEYRRSSGIGAKLICVNMVANDNSIADPGDGGMLDVVGFDTDAPQIMAEFVK